MLRNISLSELSLTMVFAEQHLTVTEKTGFSTIDKLVYLQQTKLFNQMELGDVLRVAQVSVLQPTVDSGVVNPCRRSNTGNPGRCVR